MSDGGIADDLAALSLDENGVAWGQGNSPSARRRRRNREAREAREPSVISQADTVTPAVEADDDRSSILSYPTDASDAASVTDLHFGPAADGGRWDLAGQFFNADGVRQAGITKLLVLQCIIAEFALRTRSEMPQSITQCTVVLRAELHINVKSYLLLKKMGKPTLGLKRFNP